MGDACDANTPVEQIIRLTTETIESVDADSVTLRPEQSGAGRLPGVGEIVFSNDGSGFLRRVVSVNATTSGTVLGTSQARLTDVIREGRLTLSTTLDAKNITSAKLAAGSKLRAKPATEQGLGTISIDLGDVVVYDIDGSGQTTDDQVVASGNLSMQPTLELDIDFGLFEIREARFTIAMDSSVEIDVTAGADMSFLDSELTVSTLTFAPIFVPAPPPLLTVPVVPVLEINVAAKGSASVGAQISATGALPIVAGLRFADGLWSPVVGSEPSFSVGQPIVSNAMEASVSAGARLNLLVFGVVGPSATLAPSLEFRAEVEPSGLVCELRAAFEALLALRAEILGFTVDHEEKVWDWRSEPLFNCPPNPLTGACCAGGVNCQLSVTQSNCVGQGGTWFGSGVTTCTNCPALPPPPVLGACCVGGTTCQTAVTQSSCTGLGDTWFGAGSADCTSCPGACTLPGAPFMSYPLNQATVPQATVELDWGDGANAASYDVYFGTSATPPFVANQLATSWTTSTLTVGVTYFWRVESRNSCGTTPGPTWSFSRPSSGPAPACASNPQPISGAINVPLSDVLLDWPDVPNAAYYDLYFGNQSPPPLTSLSPTASFASASGLSYATWYYWKVVPRNSAGQTDCTNTPIWSFRTIPCCPTSPGSPNPANGAIGVPLNVNLDWSDILCAESYDLYIGTTNPPSGAPQNTPNSQFSVAVQPLTAYYWKVCARNDTQSCTPSCGPVWSFTTTSQPLPDLVVSAIDVSPPNPVAGQAVSVTITIKNVGEALYLGQTLQTDVWPDRAGAPGASDACNAPANSQTAGIEIAHNGTRTLGPFSFTYSTPGAKTIWAWVDSCPYNGGAGQYAEQSETNNQLSVSVSVTQALPDLIIESINYEPSDPHVNESLAVYVTVKNIGAGPAGEFWLDVWKNAPPASPTCSSSDYYRLVSGGLAPGATRVEYWIFSYTTTGTKSFLAIADCVAQIQEANESNNTRRVDIPVSP